MKQKISNHVKNNWQEYASVILMLFIITVAMIYKFNLFNFDITYPIAYSGGDDLSMLVDAKMFTCSRWRSSWCTVWAVPSPFRSFPALR